jgi:hypothetical protein
MGLGRKRTLRDQFRDSQEQTSACTFLKPEQLVSAFPLPTLTTSGFNSYYDITVNDTQPTPLLLVAGPTINVSRSKRV